MIDLTQGLAERTDGTINPDLIDRAVASHLSRDVSALALGIQDSFNSALLECDTEGHTVLIIETYREDDVERAYWRKGRNAEGKIVRVDEVVTYAMDGAECQHCYRGAVDLTGVNAAVEAIFAKHGWKSGAVWHHSDLPHLYWGKMPSTPTPIDIADYRAGNLDDVWARYSMGDA